MRNNNDAFNTAMHEKKQDDYVKLIVRLMTTSDAGNGLDLISNFFDGLSVCVSAAFATMMWRCVCFNLAR